MSKYQFRESDIYYPGSDVPINKLGLEDPEILREIEESLLSQAFLGFAANLESATIFDEALFKSLHYETFRTLYTWSGHYRTVDMEKGGSKFCRAAYLEQESHKIFKGLIRELSEKKEQLLDPEFFARCISHFQCEIIALHPFYELNGRITRMFFDLIALNKGFYPIDYGCILSAESNDRNAYIHASIECVQTGSCDLLYQLISKGLKTIVNE